MTARRFGWTTAHGKDTKAFRSQVIGIVVVSYMYILWYKLLLFFNSLPLRDVPSSCSQCFQELIPTHAYIRKCVPDCFHVLCHPGIEVPATAIEHEMQECGRT